MNLKRAYSDEALRVFDIVRDESLRLYHLGKGPGLELLGSVESLARFDIKRLSQAGYKEIARNASSMEFESNRAKLKVVEKSAAEIQNRLRYAGARPEKVLALLGAAPGHKNTLEFSKKTYGDKDLEIVELGTAKVAPYDYAASPNDDFPRLIQMALKADLLVFATPVYWYAMSAPMKNFIDRFSNLLRGEFKNLGEAMYCKRVALLSTGWDLRLPLGFEVPFVSTSHYLAMDYVGTHYKSVQNNA